MSVRGQKLHEEARKRLSDLCALESKHGILHRWELDSPEFVQAATERKIIAIAGLHKSLEKHVLQYRKCRKVMDRRTMFSKRSSRKEGIRLSNGRSVCRDRIREKIRELRLWHLAPEDVPLLLVDYDAEAVTAESLLAENEDGSGVSLPWKACVSGISNVEDCTQRLLRAREEKSIIQRECVDAKEYFEYYLSQLRPLLEKATQHARDLADVTVSPCGIANLLVHYLLPSSVYQKYGLPSQRIHASGVVRGRISILESKISFMEECLRRFSALLVKIDEGSLELNADFSDAESVLLSLDGDPDLVREDLGYDGMGDFSPPSSECDVEDVEALM